MTLLRFDNLSSFRNLVHAVTTNRWPGEGRCDPFNLAVHVGVGKENAIAARKTLLKHLHADLPFERLTIPSQVHANNIAIIDQAHIGSGWEGRSGCLAGIDGVATALTAVPMMILSADCPLIIAYDGQVRALGLAHAGWQGTAGRIAANLIDSMCKKLGARAGRIVAGISPCAGKCCYQVGSDVIDAMDGRFIERRDGRAFLDLQHANRRQLLDSGLQKQNIQVMDICTICDERFFSHRRDKTIAGRFGLIAAII